ncbi:sensor histidine kinase [Flavobacterium sp. FlaQc-48]|uniref:sensor histidine kinase n=1 Tax=Flavobacterium sp. FlaQc-48 TaxID=3374181 RepID=UPI003756CED1
MKSLPLSEKLTERVKELTCLYEISKTISLANNVEIKVFKKIIKSIKKAWRFNNDTIVEIQISDYHLTTAKIPQNTIYQISYITIPGVDRGFIKVHYPQKKHSQDHFLDDEQKLLDTLAIEIENYIQKFQILDNKASLQKTVERMKRLSVVGEMAATIAHEINNPLANILGYAELIKLSNTNLEIDSDITTIINSVIYTREIVKKIMFFSCDRPNHFQVEEVKPVINFALLFLKPNFQKKEIKSELIFKNNITSVKIDSVQITQVLFNLLINALHASPRNSVIKIIIENDRENFFITIADQGLGIPQEIRPKIFEPFFTTKDIKEGSGLGLSIVHGIIKSHKGEIEVTNNFPTGTIFKIRLPLS